MISYVIETYTRKNKEYKITPKKLNNLKRGPNIHPTYEKFYPEKTQFFPT